MTHRLATAVLLLAFGAAACGDRAAKVERPPCVDDDPGEAATYANSHVAVGRDPRKPAGSELLSHRYEGELPRFAKTGLFVRGTREVGVRVPAELNDVVKIVGWSDTAGQEPRDGAVVQPASACAEDWTAYPGGLIFRGRHCVRLRVEGPGDARGSVLVGLGRDCFA